MIAPRDHSKAVGGLTFHYVTWEPESAPPVILLLHGLTSHARSWDALGRGVGGRLAYRPDGDPGSVAM